MDFTALIGVLLLFGTSLFAIVQYFDRVFLITVRRRQEFADKEYLIPLIRVDRRNQAVATVWGEIRRWGEIRGRYDVIVLALLLSSIPVVIAIYISYKSEYIRNLIVSQGVNIQVFVGERGVLQLVLFDWLLIFYSIALFLLTCSVIVRLLL